MYAKIVSPMTGPRHKGIMTDFHQSKPCQNAVSIINNSMTAPNEALTTVPTQRKTGKLKRKQTVRGRETFRGWFRTKAALILGMRQRWWNRSIFRCYFARRTAAVSWARRYSSSTNNTSNAGGNNAGRTRRCPCYRLFRSSSRWHGVILGVSKNRSLRAPISKRLFKFSPS